jgi:hypothetical protein
LNPATLALIKIESKEELTKKLAEDTILQPLKQKFSAFTHDQKHVHMTKLTDTIMLSFTILSPNAAMVDIITG